MTKNQNEEHMRTCSDSEATIRDDTDVEHWRIEERDLDVQMAIEVQGGLIQNIYANAGIYPDVFDLDVSDFPDKGEEDDVAAKAASLNEIKNRPGWRNVW